MAASVLTTAFFFLASITGLCSNPVPHANLSIASVGQNVSLPCFLEDQKLKVTQVVWMKRRTGEHEEHLLISYNPRFGYYPSRNNNSNMTMRIKENERRELRGAFLQLSGVQTGDGGSYICRLNTFPQGSIITFTQQLEVRAGPSPEVTVSLNVTEEDLTQNGTQATSTFQSHSPSPIQSSSPSPIQSSSPSTIQSSSPSPIQSSSPSPIQSSSPSPIQPSSPSTIQSSSPSPIQSSSPSTIQSSSPSPIQSSSPSPIQSSSPSPIQSSSPSPIQPSSSSPIQVSSPSSIHMSTVINSETGTNATWPSGINTTIAVNPDTSLDDITPSSDGPDINPTTPPVTHPDQSIDPSIHTVMTAQGWQPINSSYSPSATFPPLIQSGSTYPSTGQSEGPEFSPEASSRDDRESTLSPSMSPENSALTWAQESHTRGSTGAISTSSGLSSAQSSDPDTTGVIIEAGSDSKRHAVWVVLPLFLLILVGILYRRHLIQKRMDLPPSFKPPPPPVKYSSVKNDIPMTDILT